ncbi:MAG: transposase [Firmicutes bacterium]|nr:transposase [Bacillota bacterium]
MAKQYSVEFKMEAVRRIERTGEAVSKVAADLGVNENTMYGWVKCQIYTYLLDQFADIHALTLSESDKAMFSANVIEYLTTS